MGNELHAVSVDLFREDSHVLGRQIFDLLQLKQLVGLLLAHFEDFARNQVYHFVLRILFGLDLVCEIADPSVEEIPQFFDLFLKLGLDPFVILVCRFKELFFEFCYFWVDELFL